MKDLFEIEHHRKSAVEIVVDKIKQLLLEKKLNPGDLIPSETVLADSLKVSRGSIREAMKILSALGVVEIKRGAGTFISTSFNKKLFDPLLFKILVSNSDHKELIEIRRLMEKGIVALILENASEEDFWQLEKAQKEFDEVEKKFPGDKEKGDEKDIYYHRVMGEITHNKIASSIYNFIIDLFAPTIDSAVGYDAHRAMHQAIMKKDYDRAMLSVEEHLKAWTHAKTD